MKLGMHSFPVEDILSYKIKSQLDMYLLAEVEKRYMYVV
jgi:hypothetical protein